MFLFPWLRREYEDIRRENERLLRLVELYQRKCDNISEDMLKITQIMAKNLEDEVARHNAAITSWQNREKELCSIITEYHESLKAHESTARKWQNYQMEKKEEIENLKMELKKKNEEIKNFKATGYWKPKIFIQGDASGDESDLDSSIVSPNPSPEPSGCVTT